jgi:hypothetical protein
MTEDVLELIRNGQFNQIPGFYQWFRSIDTDGDDTVGFEEFRAMFNGSHQAFKAAIFQHITVIMTGVYDGGRGGGGGGGGGGRGRDDGGRGGGASRGRDDGGRGGGASRGGGAQAIGLRSVIANGVTYEQILRDFRETTSLEELTARLGANAAADLAPPANEEAAR